MANVVPICKRNDKQNVKNYRPVSLLLILTFYILWNVLISSNQSGFKQGDSYINQLLSITHDIYQFLDQVYEVRGVVLDISKSFDKV